ncbi:MAG: sigma-70 family RNA polymerase sigma factor [Deltaproteobacteria bacterium]|nr:sigma-70 family RNA polymerase sigma factor [Deltaproteobacteria bacterium]
MSTSTKGTGDLVRKGREKGFVTLDEIVYHSPVTQTTEQMDELLTDLADDGIEVVGLDGGKEAGEGQRSSGAAASSDSADPVTIYMRQLKSVPLLTKAAEVDAAKRLEDARLELLRAALATNIAVDEIVTVGKKTKAGSDDVFDIVEDDDDDDDDIDDDDTVRGRGAKATFVEVYTALGKLHRENRALNDTLDAKTKKLTEEQREDLRAKLRANRDEMLDQLTQLDFRESYIEQLIRRVKDLAARVEDSMTGIDEVERSAKLTAADLRRLVRARRRSGNPKLQAFTTAEFAIPPLEEGGQPLESVITDDQLAESMRLIKNAERRIRTLERKLGLTTDEILKAHRQLLAAEAKAQRAKDELVLANQRLVVHIAAKYVNRGLPFLELVQEGNLGLMRAVEKFDHRRGYKFSTYGTWWIRHAISRAIANQTRTIRLPVHVREAIRKLVKESRRHVLELGREPTSEELAQRLEIPVDRVTEIMDASRKTLRWELPVGEDGETELGTLIADKEAPSPFEEVSSKGQWEQITRAMGDLRDREQEVIKRRFGLEGNLPQTLEEVGRELGITRERVRQIQARAVRKLQISVRAENRGNLGE